jgi:O-antigen/teichoic acid export membrane protein
MASIQETINESLQTITKGAGITLFGTAAQMVLAMVTRIIVIRYIAQSEYGMYSLALALLNIFLLFSTLGIERGTSRQIGFYRGKEDKPKVREVLFSSLKVGIIASVFFSLVLFFTSDFISTRFYHTPEVAALAKILCVAIPFLALSNIFSAMFRGFNRAQPDVYFQVILRNALFPLLLIIVILPGLPFMWVVYAFVASIILTFVAYAIYTTKNLSLALRYADIVSASSTTKELLLFSLPLLLVGLFRSIITWTDTLMLGYFMLPEDVGLYNAAIPLAHLIPMGLAAINVLYIPVVSQFYAKSQQEEMRRTYVVLSKWMLATALPIFLILVLFPEFTLNIMFGSRYAGAASALQILSLGFFINAILGPNAGTLTAIGQTRFLMWATMTAAIGNVILNAVLIPPLGINGAAIASALAIATQNFLILARLYLFTKLHPFTSNYLKTAIACIASVLIISVAVRNLVGTMPLWLLPILLVSFLGLYALSMVLTRSFDKEDIMMLLAIERRLGLDLSAVKRILKRFV